MKKKSKAKVKIKIEEVLLDELSPAEYNPRKMTRQVIEDVKKSIIEFGMTDPVIVNKRKWDKNRLVVVGGHKRLIAVQELYDEDSWERKTIPCVIRRLSDAQEKALNIALNKIQDDFDVKMLTKVMEDIQNESPELISRIGFREEELRGLVIDSSAESVEFEEGERKFLDKVEEDENALWLYAEPRDEKEFEKVRKYLGNPENRMLDMDKVLKAIRRMKKGKK